MNLPAQLPPLSLYIHVPWCVRKCPYCDFNSHGLRGELPEAAYIDALLADLDRDLSLVTPRPLQTIYFGGGTPSLLTPEAVGRLLDGVRERLPLAEDAEVSLEVNPGSIGAGYFDALMATGVNRLSIGVQSFNPDALVRLGRIHDGNDVLQTVAAARAAGFREYNLDLMFGLPGQTVEAAAEDVRRVLELEPTHISDYQLTIEPDTAFGRRPPVLPPDGVIGEQQRRCMELLAEAGFDHYEVSAHALPGHESRHNLNYWRFGDYLGIGAGAHGKLTGGDGIVRTEKEKQPARYIAADTPRTALVGVAGDDLLVEFMLNALRVRQGFEYALFVRHTGLPWSAAAPGVARGVALGLLEDDGVRVTTTVRGWELLDSVLLLFVPD